jgi:uncharacterized membrane protein YphA (DoxX/SURF4 family)
LLGTTLAILRILCGVVFLAAGIWKLRDADLLYGGLLLRLEELGRPFPFYEKFIHRFFEFNETRLVIVVCVCEILGGTMLVLGAQVSLATLGAAFLLMNYAFATTSGNWLYFSFYAAGALLLLVLGRLGAGLTWGLDGWLIRRWQDWLVLFPLRMAAPRHARPGSPHSR